MRIPRIVHTTALPLLLMIGCPAVVFVLQSAFRNYGGSLSAFSEDLSLANLSLLLPRPTSTACVMVLVFIALQALLLALIPGRIHAGPVTPAGEHMTYKINGLRAWAITNGLFLAGWHWRWFSPTLVYDHFPEILAVCCLGSFLFCALLLVKGVWFPSGKDNDRSGNPVFDFYWGVELHPRIKGFDLKYFVNGRLGMMSWSVILLSFIAKQIEIRHQVTNALLVSVALQFVYLGKFYWWEDGYQQSLDVMHDRFGWYLCFGVLTWLPCVYTSPALYLVHAPGDLGPAASLGIFLFGLFAIYLNYEADAQRERVRRTGGQRLIWGKRPELILARYRTADGQLRENLLLVSGWWGVARHFHYLAEMAAALAWTLPCGFNHVLPYFYVIFLTILLVHRSFRDDSRCHAKYGGAWQEYRERVPYRIVPGVF